MVTEAILGPGRLLLLWQSYSVVCAALSTEITLTEAIAALSTLSTGGVVGGGKGTSREAVSCEVVVTLR